MTDIYSIDPPKVYMKSGIIQTIKAVRAEYNTSLYQAKRVVDEYGIYMGWCNYHDKWNNWDKVKPGHFNVWVMQNIQTIVNDAERERDLNLIKQDIDRYNRIHGAALRLCTLVD